MGVYLLASWARHDTFPKRLGAHQLWKLSCKTLGAQVNSWDVDALNESTRLRLRKVTSGCDDVLFDDAVKRARKLYASHQQRRHKHGKINMGDFVTPQCAKLLAEGTALGSSIKLV